MTDHDQPGLRMRLAHEKKRIAAQHAYLDALEATTRSAIERGDAAEQVAALRSFFGSLDAHFSLEEHVQFPALHGLDAALAPELAALEADHARYRSELGALVAATESATASRAELLAGLARVGTDLRRHEKLEEAILARSH